MKENVKNKYAMMNNFLLRKSFLNNKKRESGITLIALVITIIVLLILAGVSIATLVGDNRTINKSRRCKKYN